MENSTQRKLLIAYSKIVGKDDEKINVSMLCKKAGVARATFYLYYTSIDEFVNKCRDSIVNKLCEQAIRILNCDANEIYSVVKRKNLLFDDVELSLLAYFGKGTNYIDFAISADKILPEIFLNNLMEMKDESFYLEHRSELEFILYGFVPMLYFGLVNYDEAEFEFEMKCCKKMLCSLDKKPELKKLN